MATIKQIDANRRNAQASTGPRTEEGKQRAAANALKSGIYAESEVIFTESPEALETLKSEYHARFQPETPESRDLVDSLVRNAWLLRRLAAVEASLFNLPFPEDFPDNPDYRIGARLETMSNRLDLLQRRINSTERNYHRSLKALQTLSPPHEELASFPQNILLRETSAPPCLRVDSQPTQSKPTSEKLASFPESQKTPGGEAAVPPPDPQFPIPNPFFPPNPPSQIPNSRV